MNMKQITVHSPSELRSGVVVNVMQHTSYQKAE